MGLPDPRDPVIQPLRTRAPAEWLTKWWALFLRNDALFSTAPIWQTLFARHRAKHEAEINAPTLESSVQCISLNRALWVVCINKYNTVSLQNGLGKPMDWMLNHTLTLCPWPDATHAQWILVPQSGYSNSFWDSLSSTCFNSNLKKNPIPSVHVLWAFFLSNAVFLWVVFTFIGQLDPVIIHYDGTDLLGLLICWESPSVMSRVY